MNPLYEHQELALRKLSNGKILRGGTGSGKTRVAVEYYMLKERPRRVYVITTAKKRDDGDWLFEFYDAGIGPSSGPSLRPDHGALSGGLRDSPSGKGSRKKARPRAGVSGDSSGSADIFEGGGVDASSESIREREASCGSLHVHTRSQELAGVAAFGDSGPVQRWLDHDESGSYDSRPSGDSSRRSGRAADRSSDVRPSGQSISGRLVDRRTNDDGLAQDLACSGGDDDQGIRSGLREVHIRPGDPVLDEEAGDVGGRVSQDEQASGPGSIGQAGTYPWVVTVDSWNNIGKYADVRDAFFIFDEQRAIGSGDWSSKFIRISQRNRWILLSATPGDTWMDYVPVFIANGFYKNRTEFKREHVVYNTFTKFPKVDRYINQGRLVRQRQSILVEMPDLRHTRRRHVQVDLPYDKATLDLVLKDRWHVYEDRPLRDVAEMFLVARKVVNSDPSRLEMVKELWQNHPRLIIFYNFNFELQALRSIWGSLTPEIGSAATTAPSSSSTTTSISTKPSGLKSRILDHIDRPVESSNRGGAECSGGSSGLIVPMTGSSLLTRSGGDLPSGTPSTRQLSNGNGSSAYASSEAAQRAVGHGRPSILLEERRQVVEPAKGASSEKNANSKSAGYGLAGKSVDSTDHVTTSLAEWNGHKHQPVPTTDRWLYVVQYTAGAEGWNCITTDAMIKYSQTYSWKQDQQSEGRFDRINTPFTDLWCYEFVSDSFVDQAIRRSLKAKHDFNTSKYKSMFTG